MVFFPDKSKNVYKNMRNYSLGADHDAVGTIVSRITGETVSFGNLLYLNPLTGLYFKARADSINTMPVSAVAVDDVPSGSECAVLLNGVYRDDSMITNFGLRAGLILYVSESTRGGISTSAPTNTGSITQYIGYATLNNHIEFRPQLTTSKWNDTTLTDLQNDVTTLIQSELKPLEVLLGDEINSASLIPEDRHIRLNILQGYVIVADNSFMEQTILVGEDGEFAELNIADSYGAGVAIPLELKRKQIGFNEKVNAYATTGRRVIVKLICESAELIPV